jgi:FixJ family two-component response regulator
MERSTDLIFIVDDDPAFARGLARVVAAAGCEPRIYGSAAAFLEAGAADGGRRTCALLDVRMPGMKGPELYSAMLARNIDAPVIFLTGHGDVRTGVDAMKRGAVDFLEKPVPAELLMRTVQRALERHEKEREQRDLRRAIAARVARLTSRERQVMDHVIAGRLNKQIAADLDISLKTVKAHRGRVMEKMEARSVAGLVDMCRDAGEESALPAVRTADPKS